MLQFPFGNHLFPCFYGFGVLTVFAQPNLGAVRPRRATSTINFGCEDRNRS